MSEQPKHGRRARGGGVDDEFSALRKSGHWADDALMPELTMATGPSLSPAEASMIPTVGDEAAAVAPEAPAVEADDPIGKEVAAAPTEYHSAMPKLSELEAGQSKWSTLQGLHGDGFDVSCLTSVLCTQLDDEDVPWNQDMMLVQLLSEVQQEGPAEKGTDEGGDNQVSTAL